MSLELGIRGLGCWEGRKRTLGQKEEETRGPSNRQGTDREQGPSNRQAGKQGTGREQGTTKKVGQTCQDNPGAALNPQSKETSTTTRLWHPAEQGPAN